MAVEQGGSSSGGESGGSSGAATPAHGGSFVKQHKLLVGGLAAGGLVLLLASHGKSKAGGSQGDAQSQLDAQAASAEQQALDNQLAQESGTVVPQAVAPAAVDEQTGEPSGVTGSAGDAGQEASQPGTAADPTEAAADSAEAAATSANTAALLATGKAQTGGAKKKPAGKKKPASKKAPAKPHRSQGTHQTGVNVHGRHFPGATGHTVSGARRAGGDVHQTVKVNYGGRTDVHISVNGGDSWIDNPRGHTPPSRGTQHRAHTGATSREAPARQAPHRAAKPVAHTPPRPVARRG